jgi:predicted YcjX-like family ATPase
MRRNHSRGWPRALLVALLLGCAGTSALASDDEAVRAVAMDYAEAWTTGDGDRMARALHPAATMRRVVSDLLTGEPRMQFMDAATVVSATRDGAGREGDAGPLNIRVAILDRHGDMAAARVVSPLYVHYLQLARWDDRWVVVAILWGTVAAPGDGPQ